MIKLTIMLMTCFLLSAYSTPRVTYLKQAVKYYESQFYKDFPYATKTKLYVTPLENPFAAGSCDPFAGYVKINERYIEKYHDQGQLKGLVYHELGHCALGLSHVKNNPKKIMSTGPIGELKVTPTRVRWMKKRHMDTCLGKIPSLMDLMLRKKYRSHRSCNKRMQSI